MAYYTILFIFGMIIGSIIASACFIFAKNVKDKLPVIEHDGTKEIAYISGKMRGMDERESRHLFWVAEQHLRDKGYSVINPWEIEGKHTDCDDWGDFIIDDLRIIHQYADCVYMLNNWRDSDGAKTEHDFAIGDGIRIFYQDQNENQND